MIADASHELRTPLTAHRANIELLARPDLPVERRQRVLGAAVRAIEELSTLVGDLISAARDGRSVDARVPVALDEIVTAAVERAQLRAPQLRFESRLESHRLVGARSRLERAVDNVLDNAIKWSPPGGTVDVRLVDGTLTVRDHGPGIPATDLPHVFDRFYRAASARALPGSGLGLAIVKQTVDDHGGSVDVANADGGGALLTLRFDRRERRLLRKLSATSQPRRRHVQVAVVDLPHNMSCGCLPYRSAGASPAPFAAYIAHELRTPLATQRALLELALADPTADVAIWREIGGDVLGACMQQERLLEACLTLARSQGSPPRCEPVDLAAIAAEALRAHDPIGLESVVELEPARTTGDPELLERLAANLVSNAIRHNIAGGRIEIATRAESGRAVLSVANTGPPIPAGELHRLFQPFERLGSRRRPRCDGVGLGLAIVQEIATAHDATVTAQARTRRRPRNRRGVPALD